MNTAAIPVKGIPIKGVEQAKKKPPKLIEKVIEKVEEVLTKPADSRSVTTEPPKQVSQQHKHVIPNPKQTQAQGSLGGSSEYVLPEGTTIKLPDGNEFETHTKSKISKITHQKAGEEGGEA